MTPPLIPDPLSLLRAALAGGKVVAWLATSPLSSEIRTPLHSQSPGTEGGGAVEMEGQTGVEGWTKGERGESGVMKWEERGWKGCRRKNKPNTAHSCWTLQICTCIYRDIPWGALL